MKDNLVLVDLDGTLAEYHGYKGNDHIGAPIPAMVDRVKQWLESGVKVVIFTARAHDPDAIPPIREWLKENIGQALPVTNKKDPRAKEIWDDRAITVQRNTGKILTQTARKRALSMAIHS
jgi:hydroxymethylpyrimidine pyrophosphatase-like HAD family hydrolase